MDDAREEYLQVEQQIERVKNYNIYVLGPSGAGKTTYIPCLYHQIVPPPSDWGFFFRVDDPEKEQKLKCAYKEITGLRKWPDPTEFGEVKTWEFLCCVPLGNGTRDFDEVLQFTYFDYAGGRFSDPSTDKGKLHRDIQAKTPSRVMCKGQPFQEGYLR